MTDKGPPLPWEIRNWSVVSPGEWAILKAYGPSVPPENVMTSRIRGEIWYRPLYGNGVVLMSSPIVGLKEDDLVITLNSAYKLCDPGPEYEKAYPGARERVINSLTRLKND